MAPQLQGCFWISSSLRIPHPAPWPCSAQAQRRWVLCLAPPPRARASAVCVVAEAGSALVQERGAEAGFPLKEDMGGVVGREEEDLDERERLRRLRISKANKGNTPWNKGRKHSAETRQRIRERTRIAMQDPKVKKKLMNLGHAQSQETRIKISEGVRRGWSLRLQKLMVQDGCFVEWRDIIADAARKGLAGAVSLQWNSYKFLTEQLRQEWLDSLQKRRSMPKPRGNRRAPKTPEQRRKIAKAIAAKWLDQEYRERVCSGIASYHGESNGTRPPRKPRPAGEPGVKRQTIKKKPTHARSVGLDDSHGNAAMVKMKKSATPYKDPMAGEKLEMITKIRTQRAALEIEKKEAIRRARTLITEAEKAANALETAAATSPFAHASLIEARKLVIEARVSLECVHDWHAESAYDDESEGSDSAVLDFDNDRLDNQNQRNMIEKENKHPNGLKFALCGVNGIGCHFDTFTLNETEKHYHRNSMERAFVLPTDFSALKDMSGDFGLIDFQVHESVVNDNIVTESSKNGPLGALEEEASSSAKMAQAKSYAAGMLNEDGAQSTAGIGKMRWVRGRLVKVDDEAGYSET